MIYFQL